MHGAWLRYMGFLGLLGLLSLVTGNWGLAGFFGFFGFFGFSGSRSDERLDVNVNRAARNAFVASVTIYATAMVKVSLFPDLLAEVFSGGPAALLAMGLAASFAVQMLVFSLSLVYFEARG